MARAVATGLLGTALCLAGATFDSASLYVPGVALALLALTAFTWVTLAARGAQVTHRPGPPTVVEEEPYPLRVEVLSGLLPPPGGELLEPLLGWPVPIAGRTIRRIRINVRFSRRGRRALGSGLLVIRDPLRLHVRDVVGEPGGELLVLPRIEPVSGPGGGGAAAGDQAWLGNEPGFAGRRPGAAVVELEIDGLGPYREGSPASRIHWPTVARRGEMLERRLVADLDSAPLVVLDASAPASEQALDKAVRAAASLCTHLARQSGCAILLPGERRPVQIGRDMGAWPGVHVRLALVESGSPPPASALASRAGAVLWVTGAEVRSTPRALERAPAAARYLVAPVPPAGAVAAFEVAGCTGCRLDRARRGVAA
jgi:uncharacterized protein (DUF58 family)